MAILPIDSGRYGSPEMRDLFSDRARYQFYLDIEAALARVQSRLGMIPPEAGSALTKKANIDLISLERVRELERETKHEVVSLLKAFAEVAGNCGKYIHLGATSSDILDTAMALQVREGLSIIQRKLTQLLQVLMGLAAQHKTTLMVGRTHGQHALPITFGFKVAVWADELLRHLQRLQQIQGRVLVGKMAGAVGSMASFRNHAHQIQAGVMAELGLGAAEISTQIIPRDRIAEVIMLLALAAATLETISTEIRNLQRPEIAEVCELFGEASQIGSSTMPHKRNPVNAENVCSLARIVRSLVVPALENIPLWHERDLTNSASERFIVPEAFILLDEMLEKSLYILGNLQVYPEKMLSNLHLSQNRIMAEAIMLSLAQQGVDKFEAYTLLRELSALSNGVESFRQVLLDNQIVSTHLEPAQLQTLLEESSYVGECITLVDKILKNCSNFFNN
ncbi:MAG: adenylosuccinate lyase [Chloroflexaceae bacterium]|nr:adenylosuccinate lyase [Chloroflexaceae bacterium]